MTAVEISRTDRVDRVDRANGANYLKSCSRELFMLLKFRFNII